MRFGTIDRGNRPVDIKVDGLGQEVDAAIGRGKISTPWVLTGKGKMIERDPIVSIAARVDRVFVNDLQVVQGTIHGARCSCDPDPHVAWEATVHTGTIAVRVVADHDRVA